MFRSRPEKNHAGRFPASRYVTRGRRVAASCRRRRLLGRHSGRNGCRCGGGASTRRSCRTPDGLHEAAPDGCAASLDGTATSYVSERPWHEVLIQPTKQWDRSKPRRLADRSSRRKADIDGASSRGGAEVSARAPPSRPPAERPRLPGATCPIQMGTRTIPEAPPWNDPNFSAAKSAR